ncbi:MAG: UDP-N-acetylglucosamine--LPS N-acetylglucosamine transferase [Pseudomonadota bacterium]
MQLRRLSTSWRGCDVTYVSTLEGYRDEVMREAAETGETVRFRSVMDGSRWSKFRLMRQFLQIIGIVLTVRPDVIVTTGAAPGYFAIRVGKLLGARTVWVDSIANAEQLSLSGRMAGRHVDLWLTQWEHLAGGDGEPQFMGAVV